MATEQGICKNCGSLLVVNSNDELCECVFCDCVFPSAEAIEIFKNPDGVEFPNVPQPKRDAKASRHVVTPVFEDVVEKAVKVEKATTKETKVEKLFELSPDDVKTPPKVKRIVYIATAACVLVVLGISIPLCLIRTGHAKKIENNISRCITDSGMKVSTEVEGGYATGYKITGQSNNQLSLVSSEDVEKSQVLAAFESFCTIRGEEYGYSSSDGAHYYSGVVLTVYAPNGKFTIEGKKGGVSEDLIEIALPTEEESESES